MSCRLKYGPVCTTCSTYWEQPCPATALQHHTWTSTLCRPRCCSRCSWQATSSRCHTLTLKVPSALLVLQQQAEAAAVRPAAVWVCSYGACQPTGLYMQHGKHCWLLLSTCCSLLLLCTQRLHVGAAAPAAAWVLLLLLQLQVTAALLEALAETVVPAVSSGYQGLV